MLDEQDPEVRRILAGYEEISAANAARSEELRQEADRNVDALEQAQKTRDEDLQKKLEEKKAEHERIEAEKKKREENGEDEEKKERLLNNVWAKPKRRVDNEPSFGFEGDDEYYAEEEPVEHEPESESAPPEPAPAPVAERSSAAPKTTPPAELYDDDEGYDGSWLRG